MSVGYSGERSYELMTVNWESGDGSVVERRTRGEKIAGPGLCGGTIFFSRVNFLY